MKLRAQSSVHRYSTSSPISQLTLSSFLSDVRKSLLKGLNECLKRGRGPSHPLSLFLPPFLATTKSGGERRTMTKLSSLSLATHSFSPVVRLVLRDCVRKMALELHIPAFLFAVWKSRQNVQRKQRRTSERGSPFLTISLIIFPQPSAWLTRNTL